MRGMTLEQKLSRRKRLNQTPEWKALGESGMKINMDNWNEPIPPDVLSEFEAAHQAYVQRAKREPLV